MLLNTGASEIINNLQTVIDLISLLNQRFINLDEVNEKNCEEYLIQFSAYVKQMYDPMVEENYLGLLSQDYAKAYARISNIRQRFIKVLASKPLKLTDIYRELKTIEPSTKVFIESLIENSNDGKLISEQHKNIIAIALRIMPDNDKFMLIKKAIATNNYEIFKLLAVELREDDACHQLFVFALDQKNFNEMFIKFFMEKFSISFLRKGIMNKPVDFFNHPLLAMCRENNLNQETRVSLFLELFNEEERKKFLIYLLGPQGSQRAAYNILRTILFKKLSSNNIINAAKNINVNFTQFPHAKNFYDALKKRLNREEFIHFAMLQSETQKSDDAKMLRGLPIYWTVDKLQDREFLSKHGKELRGAALAAETRDPFLINQIEEHLCVMCLPMHNGSAKSMRSKDKAIASASTSQVSTSSSSGREPGHVMVRSDDIGIIETVLQVGDVMRMRKSLKENSYHSSPSAMFNKKRKYSGTKLSSVPNKAPAEGNKLQRNT